MKAPILPVRNKGFALIVTLSLMILLTVIAVGLLSLSSISLRASGQGEAMATAKANARLALMMALGELQKSLGPDRAITATSEILGTATAAPTKPNLTGVWRSWDDFNPAAATPPDYLAQKKDSTEDPNGRFRRWLVSSTDPAGPTTRNFANSPWVGNTVELVGAGSLGTTAPNSAKVTAGLVPVAKGGKIQGSYAWHVADESVKARINSYRDPSQNTTLAQKRALLAGHRPDASVITGADGTQMNFLPTDSASGSGQETKTAAKNFELAKENSNKLINLEQISLLENGTKTTNGKSIGKIKQFRNDVTPYSLGVMADVRRGGLKEDLSSVFEMSTASSVRLPAEFSGTGINAKGLYQTILGEPFTSKTSGFADPYWTNLAGYYNSFRSIDTPDTNPIMRPPDAIASVTSNKVPETYFPGPVIAKVDTIFSLVAHPVSDVDWFDKPNPPAKPGADNNVLADYDYFISLIYTPVVTLHNPYNVAIAFNRMKLTFVNVPVAFNFMFQAGGSGPFVSQSVSPNTFESINDMTTDITNRGEKTFTMTIANWADDLPYTDGSPISSRIVMKPGQTLICGPSLPAGASFKTGESFDYEKGQKLTEKIKGRPSYTPGLGYEVNGVAISNLREPNPAAPGGAGGGWCSFLLLRDSKAFKTVSKGTDKFYVEFQAQKPSWHTKWDSSNPSTIKAEAARASFTVVSNLQTSPTGPLVDYGTLDFNYATDTILQKFFNNRVYRYPPTVAYSGFDIKCPAGSNYAEQASFQHPFAIFSAYTRTTNGGVYETNERTKRPGVSSEINLLRDGRLAGKPFLFHNPSRASITTTLADQKPGAQAYELNLQPFVSPDDFQAFMPRSGNQGYALTANSDARGIQAGSYLEIPSGPMQTIADFRRSNALTSSYLPTFVQPIGNSLLHPLMSSNKVIESDLAISPNPMLDQSVLGNHAFYDRFYFSTFATRGAETPDTVFENFMVGIAPLPSQSFEPYLPTGKTSAAAKAELFSANKPNNMAYQKAAEYQMIRGPFNVNSTSVQAWKSVLATMNKAAVTTLWSKTGTTEVKTSAAVPILGMSLPNGGLVGGPIDNVNVNDKKTNDWNGYVELDDTKSSKLLTELAKKIVEQVRLRGPFLSLSEFVNRQVGPQNELSLTGALEKAIIDSKINDRFLGYETPGGFVTKITASDISDPSLYNYKTPAATTGNPAAGAPGWVSQGDLLRILEPAATVRSDTFVIRVCGQAQDSSGNVTARAYAEAVVQRLPDYVDPVDRPSLNTYIVSTASATNVTFGRRMNVVSFRWLSSKEI